MRVQLLVPENTMIEPEIFDRLMSAAPITLVVLAAIPLALGLIAFIVPLQIGARGVALPRLLQLSYWLYLLGGVTIYASFLYQAPESGSAALPPLSDTVFTPTNGTDAWIAGHRPGDARIRLLCDQPGRDAEQAARPWNRLEAPAAVLMGGRRDRMDAAGDRADDARGAGHARGRSPLRRCLLRPRRRWRAAALRAPLDDLSHGRLPDHLHRRCRGDLGDPDDVLAQAGLQPAGYRRLLDRDRSDRAVGVDAEHVLGADQRRVHDRGDVLRPGADRADRACSSTTGSRRSGAARSSSGRRPGTRWWRSRQWPAALSASSAIR